MSRDTYWFNEDAATVAKHLTMVHTNWTKWSSNPVMQSWVRNMISYYSAVLEPASWETALTFEGEQGELVKMQIPEARSLVRQLVALTTKQKLAFQCVADSGGGDVVQETRLGNALSNQIVEDQRLDSKGERLAEMAYVLGIAFLKSTWRSDKGDPRAATKDGGIIYDGDLEISVLSPLDVYYDYSIEDWENLDWVEVRTPKSRWSLIAQFPALKDQILKLPAMRDAMGAHSDGGLNILDDDMVYTYEVYHKPTPAVPQGRMLMYSDDRTVYFDGPNKYKGIPIEPMKPEPIMGMGFGYAAFSNLLPAQEMMDHSFSAIATNEASGAVQNVVVPRGSGISVQQIQGMTFLSYTPQNVPGGGKPEALNLAKSGPDTWKFADTLRDRLLALSNLNSAIRGQPPAGVTSGAAIATLTTNALEFLTSFSKAYAQCMERSVMHGVNAYRTFAQTPKLVRMAGKNNRSFSRKFVGSDLDPIKQVRMSMANPVMLTIAGRSDMADKALQSGLCKSLQQYFSILDGAPVETLFKDEKSENDLLEDENDSLMDGQEVRALSTDDHAAHVRGHAALLNDRAVRMNSQHAQSILNHILEHEQLAKETDPFLLAMVRTGKMPEQGPPPPGGPDGGPPPGPPGGGEMGAEPGQPQQSPAKPAADLLQRGA